MIAVPPLLALCGAALAPQARDAAGEGLAFVELSAARTTCFLEERVQVHVEFGLEESFLREKAVQPFGAKLEMPVQLSAAWFAGIEGAVVERVEPAAPVSRFVENDDVRSATSLAPRNVGGRTFVVCREDVDLIPTAVGELRLEGPALAFAYATRFEDSFLEGRAPKDRVDAFVTGKPLILEVRPLPEAGRPREFTGAVGSFSVRAEAESRSVALGGSLKLRLVVEGRGNLAQFEAPRFSEIGGFRVLGAFDEAKATTRTFTYDLAPVSVQVWQVPAIAFAFFDPEPPGTYRVVRTQPVDVSVHAAADAARPAESRRPPEPGFEAFPSFVVLVGAAIVLLAILAWIGLRWSRRAR